MVCQRLQPSPLLGDKLVHLSSSARTKNFQNLISSALQSASSPATVKKRIHAINLYRQFTSASGLSSAEAFPASELTLAAFAASLAGSRAGSTIRGIISALKSWHVQSNAPWAGGALVRDVLKGAMTSISTLRLTGSRVRQPHPTILVQSPEEANHPRDTPLHQ
jgi:hypothetical protein